MATLTVFTPAYNRAHTLPRTYESLCRQTCKDFEWLIIDDGSTDNTEELVAGWIEEGKIPIRYIKKENGGLHTGYVKAIELMESELNICIDSDDWIPDNCVNVILSEWNRIENKEHVAGLIGLDFKEDNTPIGGEFNKTGLYHLYEISAFHRGDVKIVCRTDVIKSQPPMPTFNGEKNFNPIYYYVLIDKDYKFLVINKCLCIVEYQIDGMTNNIFKQFRNSPRSFAHLRKIFLSMPYYSCGKQFKNAIHYVSSCIFAREWNMIKKSPRPITTILALPLGILLNMYIRYKTRS